MRFVNKVLKNLFPCTYINVLVLVLLDEYV